MLLIPQVFHQIWLGDKPLPAKFQRWADRWLELNPGWTMRWWTDAALRDYTPVNGKEFQAADKMAAKSDILRYEIIAEHGGIYVDSDFEPLKPLGEILDGVQAFYGDERPDTPCNAILGCAAGNAFYRHLVMALPASFAGPGDIVDKTGPRFLKREMGTFFGKDRKVSWDEGMARRRVIRDAGAKHSLHGFDWRIFYPYYYTEEQRELDAFPEAYGKHHWTASWWKGGGV